MLRPPSPPPLFQKVVDVNNFFVGLFPSSFNESWSMTIRFCNVFFSSCQTKHKVEPLSEELLNKLETVPAEVEGSPDAFFLPGGNPFIPTEFGLRADDEAGAAAAAATVAGDATAAGPDDAASAAAATAEAVRSELPASIPAVALETVPKEDWSRLLPPSLVVEGGAVSLWHKMDRSYRVPKSSIAAKLWTPEPYASPMAAVQVCMYVLSYFRCVCAFLFFRCVCRC